MVSNSDSGFSLPAEARPVIWRIFGNGESLLTPMTTRDLIDPVIRKRVSAHHRDQAIAEIYGWFESDGDQSRLRDDMREQVADLILHGVGDALSAPNGIRESETAFWAVGSIDPELAAFIIPSLWSPKDINSFVRYAVETLKMLSKKDSVLDANRIERIGASNAEVSINEVPRQRRLQSLRDLNDNDWWLYSGVGNVIKLLVRLDSEHFYTLVDRIDHPVIQVRAANCLIGTHNKLEDEKPFQWVAEGASDALVALAIVHTLNSVNNQDRNFPRSADMQDTDEVHDSTSSSLLSGLVDRLALLEPIASARWIVELLSYGQFALIRQSGGEKPHRAEELEKLCSQLLTRLVCQYWSDDLIAELREGLYLTPMTPRALPLANVAWDIREIQPARSSEIAQLILETLDDYDARSYALSNWQDHDWLTGLATALVLSCDTLDLPEWVSTQCRALPLSVWDAEQNLGSFSTAERAAQFRFLVAFYAFQMLAAHGRAHHPSTVCSLAEKLWAHCQFAAKHVFILPEDSVATEYAARIAVMFGEPSEVWILEQARNPGVDPRTLWALVDQRLLNTPPVTGSTSHHEEMVAAELLRIARGRFPNIRRFGLADLHYLAKLWLSLDAADAAEETAMAIMSFRQPLLTREDKILALKLLAFATSKRRTATTSRNEIMAIYSHLWPSSHTSAQEGVERQEIDILLK